MSENEFCISCGFGAGHSYYCPEVRCMQCEKTLPAGACSFCDDDCALAFDLDMLAQFAEADGHAIGNDPTPDAPKQEKP